MKIIKGAGGKVVAPSDHWERPRETQKKPDDWVRPKRKHGRQGHARHGRRKLSVEELKENVKVTFELPGYLLQVLDTEADTLNTSRTRILIKILEKIYGDSAWEGFLLAIPPAVNNYEDEEPLIVKQIREELERKREYEAERYSDSEGGPGEGDLARWWGDRAVPGEPFGGPPDGREGGAVEAGLPDPGNT